ncbi:Protein of unknown function [Cotesia congregata]|uniref:Uncharacterized protein n=1 Tax=Cotesia congregata TaxID=51543 RepID=A0A8J2HU50_COTCN|nr:Protein of unknown function [Cotesia congregata]
MSLYITHDLRLRVNPWNICGLFPQPPRRAVWIRYIKRRDADRTSEIQHTSTESRDKSRSRSINGIRYRRTFELERSMDYLRYPPLGNCQSIQPSNPTIRPSHTINVTTKFSELVECSMWLSFSLLATLINVGVSLSESAEYEQNELLSPSTFNLV